MISGVKCFITGTALFLGAISAFANSTAFNGYVQSSGNTGIDLSSLDGGSYRVTVTRGGQLNFRYVIGGQVFDSNPEAAVLNMVADKDASSYWNNGEARVAYSVPAPTLERPMALATQWYLNVFDRVGTIAPRQSLSSTETNTVQGPSDSTAPSAVSFSDTVTGSNFYLPPQYQQTVQVSSAGLMVPIADSGNWSSFNDNSFFNGQEVPEPSTWALLGIAGLLACALRGARTRLLR